MEPAGRRGVGLLRVEDRPEHLGQHVGAARVDVHADRRDEHHVGLLGQRVEHALQRDVDGRVDVVEGAAEHACRGGVEAVGRELRQVPELVPGDVRGAERQPREVERLLAQVQRRRVGDARRARRAGAAAGPSISSTWC